MVKGSRTSGHERLKSHRKNWTQTKDEMGCSNFVCRRDPTDTPGLGQSFIRYWNRNVFLCSNFLIYEMLTTLKWLNLDLITRFYCGTWKNGWMIELERQNTVLNFCMPNKSKRKVHSNGRTSDLMGDTERNALVENTSLFFFIMIEFSRFFKGNRTRWPHYHIKLKIRILNV